MKKARNYAFVLVTAPNLNTARKLARQALEKRLIACANLLPRIESHYHWRGKIERAAEILLILKTTRARLRELESLIISIHPYDTPEFIVLSLDSGTEKYLGWITESTAAAK